jgi:N-acetylmuramic acid 6-phosphate etherase
MKPVSDKLERLTTETRNPRTVDLDRLDALEIVQLINEEDATVAEAVRQEAEPIAKAIDVIADRLADGGRLIYVGAGTSGRLGVLDAVECPPTFSADPGQVIGLIAGGKEGLLRAVEGAEDSPEMGARDLREIGLDAGDVVVGIAASGRTPYVLGALDHAASAGAFTIGFSCNEDAELRHHADLAIVPVVGPEVLAGSTRMKAGTATKMVLNMLTTGAMVRLGKTYSNLMVDLQATNEKLKDRAMRILRLLTDCSEEEAVATLEDCGGELKTAIVSRKLGITAAESRIRLEAFQGRLRPALEQQLEAGGEEPA